MLVITRRPGEVIKIGDDIEIIVTKIRGNRTSIGIKAPDDVKIQMVRPEKEPEEDCRDVCSVS